MTMTMKHMLARPLAALVAVLLLGSSAFAQSNTTTQTTLAAAVTTTSTTVITVSSATGFTANTTYAFVDGELMAVTAVSGTNISVVRGASGTRAGTHLIGAIVHVGPVQAFRSVDPAGRCIPSEQTYLPQINYITGLIWSCSTQFGATLGGTWSATSTVSASADRVPVRLITGNYTVVASDYVVASKTYTGAITVTLPSATGYLGKLLIVTDWAGLAEGSPGGRTITVSGLINGGASDTISTTYGQVRLIGAVSATSNAFWVKW